MANVQRSDLRGLMAFIYSYYYIYIAPTSTLINALSFFRV